MARTDRSYICLACRHRFWPVRRCPACQETKWLVDLEVDPSAVTRTLPRPKTAARAIGGAGFLGLVGAGAAAAFGHYGIAEVALLPTTLALGFAAVASPADPEARPWSILPGPVARAQAQRMTCTGIVRAIRGAKLLRSPLGRVPCVAYRLAGHAVDMPIDDSVARPFELELNDGELIRVAADVATLDLPIHEPFDQAPLPAGRGSFLARRGVPSLERARVTEATLTIGERVLVIGALVENAVAEGYRATRTARSLVDAPGAPLLIRPTSA